MWNRRQFLGAGAASLAWPGPLFAQSIDTARVLCGFPAGGGRLAVDRVGFTPQA